MNLTVALTGASGSIFGQRLLRALERDSRVTHVNFIASENSLRVIAEELQLSGRSELVAKLLGKPSAKIQQLAENDIGAGPASGSYPSDGMIILPCSMGTLAGIANGLASNLIERAADVSLKERPPAHSLRSRNAIQQDPFAKHEPGRRCRGGDLSRHSCLLQSAHGCSRDGGAVRLPGAGAHRTTPTRRLCVEG